MSQQLTTSRTLEFQDHSHKTNVFGPMIPRNPQFTDHFVDWVDTSKYTLTVGGSSDAIAFSATAGGQCLFTLGQADNDACMLAGKLIWNGSKNCSLNARVTITDVSGVALFVGFSDAETESNLLPMDYKDGTLVTTADDAVGFICDADKGTSSIYLVGTKNTTNATVVDSGVDWGDTQTKELAITVDTNGHAYFWIDGVSVGKVTDAVTAATLLCPVVGGAVRAADLGETINLRRLSVWEDET
uniref:Uncharacterized protein n=1 Tax=viral metagenome TaxID=1070528 RepID=A0A6M3KGF2_9ZZZZ